MRKIDLTMPLNEDTPSYTQVERLSISQDKSSAFIVSTIKQSVHTGTHIDTPMHMVKGTKSIIDYPLERFYGRTLLFDVTNQNPIEHIKNIDCIRPNDIVLLKTNYDGKYSDYPVVSKAIAEVLVSKKIKMIGLDTPSPDTIPFAIHHVFFEHDTLILENLVNLDKLPIETPFILEAYPIPYDIEASIVRAIATLEDD